MQIIPIELGHLNLYSPSNGELICHEETGYNHNALSLMGYWVQEVMDEPFIKNPKLKEAWGKYIQEVDNLMETDNEHPGPDVDEFLEKFENATWIAFRIETKDMPGDVAWFVVNMEISAKDIAG